MLQGESIDVDTTQFTAFGKDVIRRLNLHPDTFVQLALQYTYYRIYGRYMPSSSCYRITQLIFTVESLSGSACIPIRDVHETFQAETETRPETHESETETRPRGWAFCPRRDRDETFWIRDETEIETLRVRDETETETY